jgi:hypothetical protein
VVQDGVNGVVFSSSEELYDALVVLPMDNLTNTESIIGESGTGTLAFRGQEFADGNMGGRVE